MITTLKKVLCSRALWFIGMLLLIVTPGLRAEGQQAAAGKTQLPMLKTIGIIPLQIQKGDAFNPQLAHALTEVGVLFPQKVRESKRFAVINDSITKDLWANSEGRKRLTDQFEINGFIVLTVTAQDDVVRYVVRLISPDLKENYLVESESTSVTGLITQTRPEREDFLERLTYRLINRVPVDVFIGSIQGQYLTLSGGENQNIAVGDEVHIVDSKITGIHPANGSWLTFAQTDMGTAKVIELKPNTAVAEITGANYEGAIKVGAGAKIEGINSRKKFHREEAAPEFQVAKPPVLASAISTDPAAKNAPQPAPKPVDKGAAAPTGGDAATAALASHEKAPGKSVESTPERAVPASTTTTQPENATKGPADAAVKEAASSTSPDQKSDESALSMMRDLSNSFTTVHGKFGYRSISYSGVGNVSTSIPFYLVNHIELDSATTAKLGPFGLQAFGALTYGPTPNGDLSGLTIGGTGLMTQELSFMGIRTVSFGPLVQYESTGITSETYGGENLLSIGGIAVFEGTLYGYGDGQTPWNVDIKLIPIAVGSIGAKGKMVAVTNSSEFSIDAVFYSAKKYGNDFQWGWTIGMRSASYTAGSYSPSQSEYFLGASFR